MNHRSQNQNLRQNLLLKRRLIRKVSI